MTPETFLAERPESAFHPKRTSPVIDGFTGDQRFFLAFALSWREKFSDAYLRQLVGSEPHSPPITTILGTVRNIDTWYSTFDVKPGDTYYLEPEDRVRIW